MMAESRGMIASSESREVSQLEENVIRGVRSMFYQYADQLAKADKAHQ